MNDPDRAVFPPLQACRESRATWLPRYFASPRYLSLPHQNPENLETGGKENGRLRFDIPYISYVSDVFAIFDIGISNLGFEVDPLLGLDRRQIQHIGISENAWSMVEAIVAVNPQNLPALQSLSILVAGPNPHSVEADSVEADSLAWQAMHSVDMQHFKCDLFTIPEQLIAEHPIFSRPETRLQHQIYQPQPPLRQLSTYKKLLEAWWWHAMYWDNSEIRIASEAPWWEFCSYVLGEQQNDICPLERKWCPGNHNNQEMLEHKSGLGVVDFKFLVENRCLRDLQQFGVFEIDPEHNYNGFFRFKEERATEFRNRTVTK